MKTGWTYCLQFDQRDNEVKKITKMSVVRSYHTIFEGQVNVYQIMIITLNNLLKGRKFTLLVFKKV